MDATPATAPSLDALVAGKRVAPRVSVDFAARVKGRRGEYDARLLDLSRDGALLAIPVVELGRSADEPLGPAEQFALLEEHFRDSFDLVVPERGIVVEAQVVRLVVASEDTDDLELGCCFLEPLTDGQQERLGLLDEALSRLTPWGEATLAHPLTHAADPARPVTALLHDAELERQGPCRLAPVVALGAEAFVVRLEGVTRDEALQVLGEEVVASLRRGRSTLHDAASRVAALRYVDTPRPATEVLLVGGRRLPRAVRKHFRRA